MGIPYIGFTGEAPKLEHWLGQARRRQKALDRAGQRGSEEYIVLSYEIEGRLALIAATQSLRQPNK
jgi:ubiquitin